MLQSVGHSVHRYRSGHGQGGGHQDHEPVTAAQEGAHHQRDPCHAGKPEPKHRQLPRQLPGGGGIVGKLL